MIIHFYRTWSFDNTIYLQITFSDVSHIWPDELKTMNIQTTNIKHFIENRRLKSINSIKKTGFHINHILHIIIFFNYWHHMWNKKNVLMGFTCSCPWGFWLATGEVLNPLCNVLFPSSIFGCFNCNQHINKRYNVLIHQLHIMTY